MDRNCGPQGSGKTLSMSLSARRAWIEIRNNRFVRLSAGRSLSARRAWIEISYGALDGASDIVALRKESVDRNCRLLAGNRWSGGRSPQGERG